MEPPDPAPENGASLELHLGSEGKGFSGVGVDGSLSFPSENSMPKASLNTFTNDEESTTYPAGSVSLEKTTATENEALNGEPTEGARAVLENQLEAEAFDGSQEHHHLVREGDSKENFLSPNNTLGQTDCVENLKQTHSCVEVHIEEALTQDHRLVETDNEGALGVIESSLALPTNRSEVTQDCPLEETCREEAPTHNHRPEEGGFASHTIKESILEDHLTHICQPVPDVLEDTPLPPNSLEEANIEVSLILQNKLEELGTNSPFTQNCESEQDDLERILNHSHTPPEDTSENHLASQNHILESGGLEETPLSPHQEASELCNDASPEPPGKVDEESDVEEIQNCSFVESTATENNLQSEQNLVPEGYLPQALLKVLEQDGEESSDKDLTDSASTDNTVDSAEFTSSPLVDTALQEPVLSPPSHQDEDITAAGWRSRSKHVFVLSEAGKPIYSRYGNEEALSSTMGVMMALVSFVQSGNNIIRSIYSGDHKVVFLQKGPLVLVSVSRTLQSEYQLQRELHYVYYQIISMLTQATIRRIFEHKKNYDLRRLLAGSEKILDSLLNQVETDASFLLGAVQCLPLAASVRDALNAILVKAITPNLVFSILLANSQLVTIVQEKAVIEDCRLDPTDLLLLLNLIRASSAFQAGEIWTPICLPRFNPDGYFYAYISYLDPECTVCLILLSTDKESFYSVSDCKKRIDENLRTQNLLQAIDAARQSPSYSSSLVGVPDLRHFMYKPLDIPESYKQLTQFTCPESEGPYTNQEEQQRLFDLYRSLHSRIHSSSRPLKLIYHVAEKETLLAWVTSKFELYTSYSPLVTKAGAINVITKLLRWIKKEEDRLFIRYPPKYSTTPAPGKAAKSGRNSGDRTDAAENGFFSGI